MPPASMALADADWLKSVWSKTVLKFKWAHSAKRSAPRAVISAARGSSSIILSIVRELLFFLPHRYRRPQQQQRPVFNSSNLLPAKSAETFCGNEFRSWVQNLTPICPECGALSFQL